MVSGGQVGAFALASLVLIVIPGPGTLFAYHSRLVRGHSLIQQALDYPVGESPSKALLPRPPGRPVVRVHQQIHARAQQRSSGR
ncbi:MAG TPA: hypothetical protein VNW50_09430 [Streptosporangiaceae bacterium]|nr:hypothetical protein [Streptosporangiaceae bacterium]